MNRPNTFLLRLLNCGVVEDSWESLGQQGDPTSPSWRKSVPGVHWKDWCWSWSSNTLATWCKELTYWKRPWFWERLRAGGEGDDRGWDGWMASPTRWTWVWASSGSWWMNREAWRAAVHGVTKSQTWLKDWSELNWTHFKKMKNSVSNVQSLVRTSLRCKGHQKYFSKSKTTKLYNDNGRKKKLFWKKKQGYE